MWLTANEWFGSENLLHAIAVSARSGVCSGGSVWKPCTGCCNGDYSPTSQNHGSERRRWFRLPLAIPVFVRGLDVHGKGFLEFSTLLNESAGGALLAIRRSLRRSSRITLEIPSTPTSVRAGLPRTVKILRARVIRITPVNGWNLCGLQFARAIIR
jgi:PilZ domain-containing protein